jgi:hypothetical protein
VTTAALSETVRIATLGRYRPERREILARRPSDPHPRRARRAFAAGYRDAGESAGSNGARRLGAAEGCRGRRLWRRPHHDPSLQPAAAHRDRRRSGARARLRRRHPRRSTRFRR